MEIANGMKILFLTHFYPPRHIGGTETYTHGLAKGLVNAGHQVQVLCVEEWETGAQYWNGFTDDVYDTVPVRRLNLNWTRAANINRDLYDNPVTAAFLEQYLEKTKPDIVHITSCVTLSSGVIPVVKQAGIPLIITLTDFWFICPRLTLLNGNGSQCDGKTTAQECLRCMSSKSEILRYSRRIVPEPLMDSWMDWMSHHSILSGARGLRGVAIDIIHRKQLLRERLALADLVIAPSTFLRDVFVKNDFTMPIRIISYGHDLSWLLKHPDKQPSDVIRFGYIGQIIPIKGVHVLLESFVNAQLDGKAKLSIFGDRRKDPGYARQLARIATDTPSIHFEDAFAHEHLGDVLPQLDMIVVPSLWAENNPLVIQESFAAKVPVIATALQGLSEFVHHEQNGLLFKLGDQEDLTRQLLRVVNEPDLIQHLRNGITKVKDITESVIEIVGLYVELAG
jgi:glycosyltransferase involved in cell wall biosynthesis